MMCAEAMMLVFSNQQVISVSIVILQSYRNICERISGVCAYKISSMATAEATAVLFCTDPS